MKLLIFLRNSVGVSPFLFLKLEMKTKELEKPTLSAMSEMVALVAVSRFSATAMR